MKTTNALLRLPIFASIASLLLIVPLQCRLQLSKDAVSQLESVGSFSALGSKIRDFQNIKTVSKSAVPQPNQNKLLQDTLEIGTTLTDTISNGASRAKFAIPEAKLSINSKSIAAIKSSVSATQSFLRKENAIDLKAFNDKIDKPNTQAVGWGPQFLTDSDAIRVSEQAELFIGASKKAVETISKSNVGIKSGGSFAQKVSFRKTLQDSLRRISPRLPFLRCPFKRPFNCKFASKYRTADGSCNNQRNPIWGKSVTPFERFLFPMYNDGINSPRTLDINNDPLPGAREISLAVHQNSNAAHRMRDLSHFTMEYGQFVSHDIQMNALSKGYRNSNLDCCRRRKRRNCFPIDLPKSDPYFGRPNIKRTCMNFVRALKSTALDCKLGPRQQLNQNTHYLDGSAIYGSNLGKMNSLRERRDGLLKSSENGKLLPKDMSNSGACRLPSSNSRIKCFHAGDVRVNQQPALISLQTIWMKEHNRIAKILKANNPTWNDETLFQEARKIVIAELQHVTYKEYLLKILGRNLMNKFELTPRSSGYFTGYNEKVKPMIRNAFSAAAYRFGHSMIDQKLAFHSSTSPNFNSDFRNVMLRPDWIYRPSGVSSVTRGLYETNSQSVDRFKTYEVTRHLFEGPPGTGIDLAAVNIQRGRDHGIPSYNIWRDVCGLPIIENFNVGVPGGLNDHDAQTANKLRIYKSVDDIDLFTGGVSELNLPGAKVGPTFACLIGLQFKALKFGDRFFYESNTNVKLPTELLTEIRKTSMAKIICDNTDIKRIPKDVFTKKSSSNPEVSCSVLKGVKLQTCKNGGWSSWRRLGRCMQVRSCICGKPCSGKSFKSSCSIDIFSDLRRPRLTPAFPPMLSIK